jgi:hypothetical protein
MLRLLRLLVVPALLALAGPSLAAPFTVLGWDLGENITAQYNGSTQSFNTVLFRENANGVLGTSFCADLGQTISTGTYTDFIAYNPSAAPSTAPQGSFVFAAQIANVWSNNIPGLATTLGITQVQAITGVQAAIWESVYGDAFAVTSMSAGAQSAYNYVRAQAYTGYGNTMLYRSLTRQDQLFTPPVPEPTAMILFGAGALLVGRTLARRRQLA